MISAASSFIARQVDLVFRANALKARAGTRRRSSAEGLPHEDRIRAFSVVQELYERAEVTLPGGFFEVPNAIEPVIRRKRRSRNLEVLDLRWQSALEPVWGRTGFSPEGLVGVVDQRATLAEKYLSERNNMVAHARWFRHRDSTPRPCVMILHGYLAGDLTLEELLWPTRALFGRGYDVVLTVLPFHGARRSAERRFAPPRFPSSDPRFTIEGFRQLVLDHRALADYLTLQGAPSVGVMGMSLGGYGASLLATTDARWSFVVPVIPLACMATFADDTGRFTGTDAQRAEQRDAMAAAQRSISPLARAPLVSAAKTIIVVGTEDRVTGPTHAQRLAGHFGCETVNYRGGHLLQLGLQRAVVEAFDRVLLGVLDFEPTICE